MNPVFSRFLARAAPGRRGLCLRPRRDVASLAAAAPEPPAKSTPGPPPSAKGTAAPIRLRAGTFTPALGETLAAESADAGRQPG